MILGIVQATQGVGRSLLFLGYDGGGRRGRPQIQPNMRPVSGVCAAWRQSEDSQNFWSWSASRPSVRPSVTPRLSDHERVRGDRSWRVRRKSAPRIDCRGNTSIILFSLSCLSCWDTLDYWRDTHTHTHMSEQTTTTTRMDQPPPTQTPQTPPSQQRRQPPTTTSTSRTPSLPFDDDDDDDDDVCTARSLASTSPSPPSPPSSPSTTTTTTMTVEEPTNESANGTTTTTTTTTNKLSSYYLNVAATKVQPPIRHNRYHTTTTCSSAGETTMDVERGTKNCGTPKDANDNHNDCDDDNATHATASVFEDEFDETKFQKPQPVYINLAQERRRMVWRALQQLIVGPWQRNTRRTTTKTNHNSNRHCCWGIGCVGVLVVLVVLVFVAWISAGGIHKLIMTTSPSSGGTLVEQEAPDSTVTTTPWWSQGTTTRTSSPWDDSSSTPSTSTTTPQTSGVGGAGMAASDSRVDDATTGHHDSWSDLFHP